MTILMARDDIDVVKAKLMNIALMDDRTPRTITLDTDRRLVTKERSTLYYLNRQTVMIFVSILIARMKKSWCFKTCASLIMAMMRL